MCGPSSAETSQQASTASFANLLQSNYAPLFAKQQGVLDSLNKSLSPISAAGPSQRGFSGAETSALQTQAIENAGAAARSAEQAARTFGAGEGGGATSGVTSGITKQIESAIASQQAGKESEELNKINLADFQQGNQNFWRAQGGMEALASQYNPASTASEALNAGGQSFQEASKINQENNALGEDIAGFATAAIGSAGDIYKAFKAPGGG